MIVYFFEYVASTGAADKANTDSTSKAWLIVHSYAVLAFCYQVPPKAFLFFWAYFCFQFGVLISRSSLVVVKIRWVEALSILQGINFALWILQAHFHFMNIYIQMIAMVYVGLLGGASYVNIFYLILHDEDTSDADKELCVNICAFASTFGITFSSLFVLLMDATFLATPSHHSNNSTVICNVTRPHHPW
jgi:battenin